MMRATEPTGTLFTIASFVCVDTRPDDAQVQYPLMGPLDPEERRLAYWRLATAALITSRRVQPEKRHLIFTNDTRPVLAGGQELRHLLERNGIEIIQLPFERFRMPVGMSLRFANAFYRFEALGWMAAQGMAGLLMDADCLYLKRSADLESQIYSGNLLVYDIYSRSHKPYSGRPHGISMADMGQGYRLVDEAYPIKYPVWLGTEVIGGEASILGYVVEEVGRIVDRYAYHYKRGAKLPQFPNGTCLFNNDEFLFSFVANRLGQVEYLNPYLKRMYALPWLHNLSVGDEQLPLWHLPSEKNSGLDLLFNQVADPMSEYWRTPVEGLARLVGSLVGVPRRRPRIGPRTPFQDLMRNIRGRVGVLIRNNF